MDAIENIKKYPKYLKVTDIVNSWSWNKYLPIPWKQGELVKVAPEGEQHSSKYVNSPDKVFRKGYVVIYRKDAEGKFTIRQTGEWRQFELLTK